MKVSVIIPAFNAMRWLPETLISAVAEAGPEVEVVLVDDGSTDGTADYVRQRFPQVRVTSSSNQGCSAARSLGFAQARGELIKFLDADDLLLPGIIGRQRQLARDTGAEVIYGNWRRIEEKHGRWVATEEVCRRIEEVDADDEIAFLKGMWCPTGAYLWRSDFLRVRHPGWHKRLPVIQDARFPLDAAASGARFVHDPVVGVHYRVHQAGSVSTRSRLTFLRDCQVSLLEIEARWAESKDSWAIRRDALLQAWGGLVRASYAVDAALFTECWEHLQMLAPGYLPGGGRGFRALSRLLGYRAAEAASQWWHRGRRFCGRLPQR